MMTPERMRRVLFVTSRKDAPVLIRTLFDLRAVHIIEHVKGEEGLDLGRPLPEASEASSQLVRIRSVLRHIGAEGRPPSVTFRVKDIQAGLRRLDAIESDVEKTIEAIAALEAERNEKNAEIAQLEPLVPLEIPVELLRDYESLRVFVGSTESDPTGPVQAATEGNNETFRAGTVTAVFVPAGLAEKASDALQGVGFREFEIPPAVGLPSERLSILRGEVQSVSSRLDAARSKLEKVRERDGDFLAAAEEHLSIEVTRAEGPLQCGATDNALFVEAWIPEDDFGKVRAELGRALGERVHLEFLEDADGHEDHVAHHEEGEAGNFPVERTQDRHREAWEPPTKMRNPAGFRPFQYFTEMFSTPKYEEVDPTIILAIAFPVFFGFMIGDFGLGIVMLILGWLMATKLRNVEGLAELGVVIAVAGAVAAVLGGIVFMDAFGIPFGFTTAQLAAIPAGTPACAPAVYTRFHETNWGCLLGLGPVTANPFIAKTEDIITMLLISLVAGGIHLAIGLIFGIRNEARHNAQHAIAKVAWLILLFGFFAAALYLLDKDLLATYKVEKYALPFTGVTLVLGVLGLVFTEGGMAIMEVPSLFSNTLSYLRLGAVAVAKGAMAGAFNGLTLLIALGGLPTGNYLVVVLGLVGFLLAQVILFALGLLSSGIQAIRLNYVEFFTKFYKGGGIPFRPFGRIRRYTTEG
jgi:V/A-type H+-transporting ATPase subunit I